MKNTIKKISLGSTMLMLGLSFVGSANAQTNRQPVKSENEVRSVDQNRANQVNKRSKLFDSKRPNDLKSNSIHSNNRGSSQTIDKRKSKAKNEIRSTDQNKANQVNKDSKFNSAGSSAVGSNIMDNSSNTINSSQRVNSRKPNASNQLDGNKKPLDPNNISKEVMIKGEVITDKKVNVRSSKRPVLIAPGNNQKSNSGSGKSGN